jgi:serine/threonine protein kinase
VRGATSVLTNINELLGRALGTCTLKRLIGRGGMGAVYLAQQSRPKRTVAVKVLLPHLVEARPREEFLARFRREADAIAALDHINIMPIYEYGEQGDAAFLVMPYVMGGTLRERLEVQPILPIQDIVSIIEQVAAGLDCAHALGIIHRDLKPGNILFHADGRVLITDFGLAKMLKDVTERDSGARALTSAGSIVGTPEYLSPEQSTGSPTDYHTDVYSLGVVLYQMLAGRVPFTGTTSVAVAIKHALQEPPPITQFNPAIPHSVQAVVMKALAKAPEQRFASAGELARALRLAISEQSATTILDAPDAMLPSVTTNPTTDSPQIVEQANDYADHERELQAEEDGTIPVLERQQNDQSTDKRSAVEVNKTNQIPQEEMLPEKVPNLSTLLMRPDGDDFHNVLTKDGSPTSTRDKAFPPVIAPMEATQEDKPAPKAFDQNVALPVPETGQPQHSSGLAKDRLAKMTQHRPGVSQIPAAPAGRIHTRVQPVWTIIIGSLLTCLIIAAGFLTYLHLLPTRLVSSTAESGVTATAINQVAKTPSPPHETPTAIPALAAISPAIAAGPLLYGTPHPFSTCDKQGGHWSNTSGAQVACNADGGEMINGSGHLAIANLDQLAGNQSPWPSQSFIVQVQVTVNPNSHGLFGIDFFPQTSDGSQGYFAYLLDQSGNWTFNHYDTQGNVMDTLISEKLLSSVSTTLTIDIRVEGTNYAFYVNGIDTTGRASTGSQFISKIVGLAVDANANVTFSNLAIYALS